MTIHNPSFLPASNPGRKQKAWSPVRSDSAIEEEIWARLAEENARVFSADHIAVEVEQGEVQLLGHVAEEGQRQQARWIAAQVPGVAYIRNKIIPDSDLRTRVLRALNKDPRTAAYLTPVKCTNGWVSLGGIVPTPEAAEEIETVAAGISDVRGIVGTPWVVGLPWANSGQSEPLRRTFQPRIGALVHESLPDGASELPGLVSQVIIDPRSRLLTHVVTQVWEKGADQRPVNRVIPVSAIEAANREHVWLKAGESIGHYHVLQAYRYPSAPQDWRPPFPYAPDMVRWSSR